MKFFKFFFSYVVLAVTIILLKGTFSPVLAAESQAIELGSIHKFKSDILNEVRDIWVYTPDNYGTSGEQYPVVYLTDSWNNYHHIIGTMRFLQRNGKMPEMIVVGIVNTDRARDLSPGVTEKITHLDGQAMPDMPTAGGADNFLKFFEEELFPYIEGNYHTAPYRVFAGHSLGGLLAVHSFVNYSTLFQGYIIASPSLWWNNGAIVPKVENYLKATKDLSAKLYVTMGNEGGLMHAKYEEFIQVLKENSGDNVSWGTRHMPNESHGSVVLKSFYEGFEKLFDGWKIPWEIFKSGDLEWMIGHYAKWSEQLGYRVNVPESAINRMGYVTLAEGNKEKAIEIFEYNTKQYPNSANVYDSFADALEADGQLKKAKESLEMAVQIGTKNSAENLLFIKKHLIRVTDKLGVKPEAP